MSGQKSYGNQKSRLSGRRPGRVVGSALICLVLLLAVGAGAAVFLFSAGESSAYRDTIRENDGKMETDLERLSVDTYDSVLISMHSAEPFNEEDFALYLGQDTVVTSHTLMNTGELSSYLDCVLQSGNILSNIYLCLDPELLWINALGQTENWERILTAGLYSYISANPGISFKILLPYPHISYWMEFQEEDLNTLISLYRTLVNELSAYPNTKAFFPGAEEWLMISPGNYDVSIFDANEIVTNKLFLYTFCDFDYQITPENEAIFLNTLLYTVNREKDTPTHYPDLSDWCIVFLGDSVLGNYPGSFAISGYVSDLSGALSCNFAIGGTTGTLRSENGSDFPNILDRILTENVASQNGQNIFVTDGAVPEELSYKKLCFVINYGLNDYFSGLPVEDPGNPEKTTTYKGSIHTGIRRLQAVFPDADYIVMSPTHVAIFNNGMQPMSDVGSILPAYVKADQEVTEEMGLYFLDNYNDCVVTEENMDVYLADGVHLNERGRLTIASVLMYFIEENLK